MLYILTLLLFLIGVFGIFTQRNIIKIIISISIVQTAVNVFLILIGYKEAGIAPIITGTYSREQFLTFAVDPFPQAMVLTSIVIELSMLALMVAIALRIYHTHQTYDIDKIIAKMKNQSQENKD